MTLTDTVSSLAHDAASVASDLGNQAVGISRNAADAGIDAATHVAAAAGQLAQSLLHKVPAVAPRKRRSPWLTVALVGAAVAAVAVFVRRRPGSAITGATSSTASSAPSTPRPASAAAGDHDADRDPAASR